MTPWHDCAPSHSRPDGAVVAGSTHRATHRPRQLAPTRSARDTSCLPLIDPAPMAARPPSSCQCGCLTPPSSPSIGIWPGPFAFPYPSSLVSTTGRPRFGGFGISELLTVLERQALYVRSATEPPAESTFTICTTSSFWGGLSKHCPDCSRRFLPWTDAIVNGHSSGYLDHGDGLLGYKIDEIPDCRQSISPILGSPHSECHRCGRQHLSAIVVVFGRSALIIVAVQTSTAALQAMRSR